MLKRTYVQVILTMLTHLSVEIFAVNSPQMTFFTPPSHEAVIHLESKYGHSATLKLTRQSILKQTKDGDSLSYKSGNYTKEKKVEEFVIYGPDYPFHGVSAIIQEMNLRTSTENFDCRDFVQFSANASMTGHSNKICGKILRDKNWNVGNITDPRLQRSFFSPEGIIHLHFYSDQLDNSDGPSKQGELTDTQSQDDISIEIVFTSYTVCPNPANSWKKLKPCSSSSAEKMSCIYSTLFCDSKVDCGFPGEFGVDEEGCYIPYIYIFLCTFAGLFVTFSLMYIFVRWVTQVPKEYQLPING